MRISKTAQASIGIFVIVLVLMFLRRPDALLNPQPYAEDGIWLDQAIANPGLEALVIPFAGYLDVVIRIVTSISLLAGLANAPFLMNLSALILGAYSVSYLARARFRILIPKDLHRFVLCVLIACLPIPEIFLTITNVQWFLLLYLTLWISDQQLNRKALSERKAVLAVLDSILASLVFLSAPLALFLAPVTLLVFFRRGRNEGFTSLNTVIGLGPILSAIGYTAAIFYFKGIATTSIYGPMTLPSVLFVGQVFSTEVVTELLFLPMHLPITGPPPVAPFVLRFGVWPWYLTSSLLLLFLLYAVAKKKDLVGLTFLCLIFLEIFTAASTPIRSIELSWAGVRFLFLPMCLLLIVFMRHLMTFDKRWLKKALGVFLLIIAFNLALHYQLTPFVDYRFQSYAQEFHPDGGWHCVVPINPPGDYMTIPCDPQKTYSRLKILPKIGEITGAIELFNGLAPHGGDIMIVNVTQSSFALVIGWVHVNSSQVGSNTYLIVDGHLAFATSYDVSRPKIAPIYYQDLDKLFPASAENMGYGHTGWLGTITLDRLSPGLHNVSLMVIQESGSGHYDTNSSLLFQVA